VGRDINLVLHIIAVSLLNLRL